jgi:hypothetical protein
MGRTAYRAPQGWLSRPQAAKYLGLSEKVFRHRARRHGLVSKIDRGVNIYRVEDIEAFARLSDDVQ